jgi:hypothetical protein
MQQNAQNFVNPAFADIFTGITAKMPTITFAGIIGTYAVTAGLNVYFLPLPLFIGIPAALALQFGRFAIVFTDYLNPTGTRSAWPPFIAAVATIVALTELGFSCKDMGFSDARFWAVFLFGGAVISFGYLLEINFISKGAEAFNLGSRHRPQGVQALPTPNQVNQANQQQPAQVQQPAPRFTYAPNGNGKHHGNGVSNQVATEPPRATVQHLGSHARATANATVSNATVTHVLQPGEKPCDQCGQIFKPRVEWGRFCCKDCKEKYHASQHNGQAFNPRRYHKKAQA